MPKRWQNFTSKGLISSPIPLCDCPIVCPSAKNEPRKTLKPMEVVPTKLMIRLAESAGKLGRNPLPKLKNVLQILWCMNGPLLYVYFVQSLLPHSSSESMMINKIIIPIISNPRAKDRKSVLSKKSKMATITVKAMQEPTLNPVDSSIPRKYKK